MGVSPTPNQMIASGHEPEDRHRPDRLDDRVEQVFAHPEQAADHCQEHPGGDAENEAFGHPLQRDEQVGLQHALRPRAGARR